MAIGKVINVDIPVGTLAALLTALEYLLSTISAFAIRASIHGFWLVKLHRGGKAAIDSKQRGRSGLRKDIISAILGIWLVIGVALVESNLRPGFRVADTPENSSECVSVYGKYRSERIHDNIPPYRTTVEPWIVRVATELDCGEFGIASVGVGGSTDSFGEKQGMSAPICSREIVDIAAGEVAINITSVEVDEEFFESEMSDSNGIVLFPADTTNLGRDNERIAEEEKTICNSFGISTYFYSIVEGLETEFAHGLNMSLGIHERLCTLHGSKPINTVPVQLIDSCRRSNGDFDLACVREGLSDQFIYSATITDVSALVVGAGLGPSYACTIATVLHEYVFIAPESILASEGDAIATLPVLLIISAKVTDGYCERTIAPLGQAALLYSADAVWRMEKLSMLKPRQRYYAYLMAVSQSQFPLNHVSGEEDSTGPDGCFVHRVREVTEIPVDWRLIILIIGLICVIIVAVIGIIFRMQFTGESWAVGSAQWSLTRLLQSGRENGRTMVEVVPVEESEVDVSNTETSRSSLPMRKKSRLGEGEEDVRSWRLFTGRCEYRMRTVTNNHVGAGSSEEGDGKVGDIEAPTQEFN